MEIVKIYENLKMFQVKILQNITGFHVRLWHKYVNRVLKIKTGLLNNNKIPYYQSARKQQIARYRQHTNKYN